MREICSTALFDCTLHNFTTCMVCHTSTAFLPLCVDCDNAAVKNIPGAADITPYAAPDPSSPRVGGDGFAFSPACAAVREPLALEGGGPSDFPLVNNPPGIFRGGTRPQRAKRGGAPIRADADATTVEGPPSGMPKRARLSAPSAQPPPTLSASPTFKPLATSLVSVKQETAVDCGPKRDGTETMESSAPVAVLKVEDSAAACVKSEVVAPTAVLGMAVEVGSNSSPPSAPPRSRRKRPDKAVAALSERGRGRCREGKAMMGRRVHGRRKRTGGKRQRTNNAVGRPRGGASPYAELTAAQMFAYYADIAGHILGCSKKDFAAQFGVNTSSFMTKVQTFLYKELLPRITDTTIITDITEPASRHGSVSLDKARMQGEGIETLKAFEKKYCGCGNPAK